MDDFSAHAVSEGGKAVALAVVLSMLAVYVPLLAFVLIPVLPLPLGFLVLRRGVRVGLAAALATSLLGLLFAGLGEGMLAVLFAGLLGVVLGVVLRRRWGFSAALLGLAATSAAALCGWLGAVWLISGMDTAQLSKIVDDSLAATADIYRSMGLAQATVDDMVLQVREVIHLVPYVLPAIAGIAAVLLATAVAGLAAAFYGRMGETMPRELRFGEFRLHWSAAYGFIAGLALLVVAPAFSGHVDQVRLVGLNLLLVFQTLFFVQGLAVVHWIVVNRRISAGKRVVVYGLALVGQMLLQLTSWAGLLDTWFDYRKRFSPRGPGRERVASADPGAGDREER